jgi:putative transposase
MSRLRRYYSDGQIYFVTAVTQERRPLLIDHSVQLLDSIEKYRRELQFRLGPWVLLPDHLHMIIDPQDGSLSTIMQRIKLSFSKKIRFWQHVLSGKVWQARFWDHIIRDQEDLNRHIDYIHYNPVKHGLVDCPHDWMCSSIYDYGDRYSTDWGVREPLGFEGEFGE